MKSFSVSISVLISVSVSSSESVDPVESSLTRFGSRHQPTSLLRSDVDDLIGAKIIGRWFNQRTFARSHLEKWSIRFSGKLIGGIPAWNFREISYHTMVNLFIKNSWKQKQNIHTNTYFLDFLSHDHKNEKKIELEKFYLPSIWNQVQVQSVTEKSMTKNLYPRNSENN